jgi:hypothetical protein
MTQYATMVGNICLDKAQDDFGQPAPVTFSVRKVMNGAQPWQQRNGNTTFYRGAETLEKAIVELHSLFQREMQERDYELRVNDGTDGFGYSPHKGESGWYDLDKGSDAPAYTLEDYPEDAKEWVKRGITSYAYDNYAVKIVTSAGNIVY